VTSFPALNTRISTNHYEAVAPNNIIGKAPLNNGIDPGKEAAGPSDEQAKGGDDLRAKVQNPVSSMYSLPLKLTADFGAATGSAYFLI
jgi:hypothetical protein